jgi:hypothetical protein
MKLWRLTPSTACETGARLVMILEPTRAASVHRRRASREPSSRVSAEDCSRRPRAAPGSGSSFLVESQRDGLLEHEA